MCIKERFRELWEVLCGMRLGVVWCERFWVVAAGSCDLGGTVVWHMGVLLV